MRISELENAPQWLLDAKVQKEDVEIIDGKVIWKYGIWESGTWEDGIWENGIKYLGRWSPETYKNLGVI